MAASKTVLLTGASGFIGQYLFPVLQSLGFQVRCASRDPERARLAFPDRDWVSFDTKDVASMARAMEGCEVAYYLLHFLHYGKGFADEEEAAAKRFRQAADLVQLPRVIYLGGVAPRERPSLHLRARMTTGIALRGGRGSAVELRAAMVLGAGSASWLLVRDLVDRLPFMLLPRWLRNHSWPVAVEDAVAALALCAMDGSIEAGAYDIPGSERVTHQALLAQTAKAMHRRPWLVPVPVLSPRLSSYWIAGVTRARLKLTRELVCGLAEDLDPSGPVFWNELDGYRPCSLHDAIDLALRDEKTKGMPSAEALQRTVHRTHQMLDLRRPHAALLASS